MVRAELVVSLQARVFAKVGLVGLLVRAAIVVVSGVAGLLVMVDLIPPYVTASGFREGTPVHPAGFYGTWIVVTFAGSIVGNWLISRRLARGRARSGFLLDR
jgi:hypothetical protein